MENPKEPSTAAPGADVQNTAAVPILPKAVPLKDGRIATVHPFQAAQFVQAVQEVEKSGNKDEGAIAWALMAHTVTIDDAPISTAIIDNMRQSDIRRIQDVYVAEISDIDVDHVYGTTRGKLPSGKCVTIREPLGKDIREAGRVPEMRAYRLVEACAQIDGKPIEAHDAALMDGLDFMAISVVLNSDPD